MAVCGFFLFLFFFRERGREKKTPKFVSILYLALGEAIGNVCLQNFSK